MKYLVIFQIGSIQSFINTSRRTYDLWSGSWILSELIRASINRLIYPNSHNKLIYPSVSSKAFQNSKKANLPNKLIALISGINNDELRKLLNDAENEVHITFRRFADAVKNEIFRYFPHISSDSLFIKTWERQIENIFEVYWSFIQINDDSEIDDPQKYKEKFKELSLLNKSRKLIRNFNQGVEKGPRCSLCGKMSQLTSDEKSKSLAKYREFWESFIIKVNQTPYRFTIKDGEKLCAPCLTRRLLPKVVSVFSDNLPRIPSTSSIAVGNILDDILAVLKDNTEESMKLRENLIKFIDTFKDLKLSLFNTECSNIPRVEESLKNEDKLIREVMSLDGEAFILDTYRKDVIKKYCIDKIPTEDKLEKTEKIIKEIHDILRKIKNTQTSKYFAIIMCDGDDMGKWLSGHHPDITSKFQFHIQSDISNRLFEFGSKIAPYVIEKIHRGIIIYWGGDEGLAMSCIEDVMSIIRYLRTGFSGKWQAVGDKFIPDFEMNSSEVILNKDGSFFSKTMGLSATLSVGVAIAHHQESLLRVLEESRESLKIAKKSGKDCFCFSIIKRSGEPIRVLSKFVYEQKDKESNNKKETKDIIDLIITLINFYRKGLSDSWIYEISKEIGSLSSVSIFTISEISRLIRRRKVKDLELSEILRILKELFHACGYDLDKFIKLNMLASYIAKGGGT